MKRQSFRYARRKGILIQTRIKSREWFNESSSFSNNLVKRQSFHALRGGGGLPLPAPNPLGTALRVLTTAPPEIKSWLRAWEGCNLPHASTTLVALIHCRKYFGTYHPPQPRIQIDTLGGFPTKCVSSRSVKTYSFTWLVIRACISFLRGGGGGFPKLVFTFNNLNNLDVIVKRHLMVIDLDVERWHQFDTPESPVYDFLLHHGKLVVFLSWNRAAMTFYCSILRIMARLNDM